MRGKIKERMEGRERVKRKVIKREALRKQMSHTHATTSLNHRLNSQQISSQQPPQLSNDVTSPGSKLVDRPIRKSINDKHAVFHAITTEQDRKLAYNLDTDH